MGATNPLTTINLIDDLSVYILICIGLGSSFAEAANAVFVKAKSSASAVHEWRTG